MRGFLLLQRAKGEYSLGTRIWSSFHHDSRMHHRCQPPALSCESREFPSSQILYRRKLVMTGTR